MGRPAIDVSEQRFGRLLVVERAHNGPQGHVLWLCKCDCGRSIRTSGATLARGKATSCGCARTKHGHIAGRPPGRHSLTYTAWASMLQRCDNPKSVPFKYYGARGISVCERWRTFENFLADMGEKPAGLSLDRINNDGNYEPGNCRWATASQQQTNKRRRATP